MDLFDRDEMFIKIYVSLILIKLKTCLFCVLVIYLIYFMYKTVSFCVARITFSLCVNLFPTL